MRDQIIERLQQIELENNVAILYACESGSRAWGFPRQTVIMMFALFMFILNNLAPFEVRDEVFKTIWNDVNFP